MICPHPDWETEAFLAEVAGAEGPTFDDLTLQDKRDGLEAMLLEAEPHAPDVETQMISVPMRDGRQLSGYTCRPEGSQQLPVLFLIQGGGWAFATAKPYGPLAALLAVELNRLVVCVDFRLSPEHPFPAGLEDCIDTYRWLQAHADRLDGDSTRIALFGDSSGGNIATAVALSCPDETCQSQMEALVLAYPMIDVTIESADRYPSRQAFGSGDYFLTQASIDWAADHYVPEAEQRAHPLVSLTKSKVLAQLPKTTIITAGMDPLRDEAGYFAGLLEEAGVDVRYRVYDNTVHGFMSFFHRLKPAHRAVAFIKKQLV